MKLTTNQFNKMTFFDVVVLIGLLVFISALAACRDLIEMIEGGGWEEVLNLDGGIATVETPLFGTERNEYCKVIIEEKDGLYRGRVETESGLTEKFGHVRAKQLYKKNFK